MPVITAVPRIILDNTTGLFAIIGTSTALYDSAAANPIMIKFSAATYSLFQSINASYYNNEYTIIFTNIFENQYGTTDNALISRQSFTSVKNLADPKILILSSNLPIQPEYLASLTTDTNLSSFNIVNQLSIDYTSIQDLLTGYNYNTITNRFRECPMNRTDISLIRFSIFYLDGEGKFQPIYLPPGQIGIIKIEIYD